MIDDTLTRDRERMRRIYLYAARYEWLRERVVGMGMRDAPTWATGEGLDRIIDHELRKVP